MSPADTHSRRTFLKAAGSVAATASIAGCLGDNTGDGGDGNDSDGGGGNESDGGDGGGGDGGDGGSEPTGTLVYARGAPSATLDPQNTTSGEDVKVTNQIYNQLVQFVPGETSLEAGLATEYNLDGQKATLKLREGVTFHNGEEFTAADFEATFRRFTDSSYEHYPGDDYVSAYGAFTLGSWVESVNVQDDYNIELQLTQQYAPFLRNLAMFASSVLSEKAIQEKGQSLATEPVGTGPFKLEAYEDSGNNILLTANTEFWGDEGPKTEQVIFRVIPENSTRAQALSQNEVQIIDGLGASSSQQVENASGVTLESFEGINIGYMAMNMARFEPFRKKKVRQAVSYAINTKAIVDNIFEGFAEQASQPVPSNVLGHNDSLDPYPHDPDQAETLLQEAGHGDGFEMELATFQNPRGYNPSPLDAAQQVKTDLGNVGITVTINQMAFDPFLNYTSAGKHDACFLGWYTDNADPDNFFYSLLHPGVDSPEGQDWVNFDTEGFNTLDVAGWANKEYMDTVVEAQKTYEESQREELYQEAAQIAHDEAPWVFMDHAKELRGVSETVSGYVPSAIGGPYLYLASVSE